MAATAVGNRTRHATFGRPPSHHYMPRYIIIKCNLITVCQGYRNGEGSSEKGPRFGVNQETTSHLLWSCHIRLRKLLEFDP